MSKVEEDRGEVRVMVDGKIKYVHELLLDCGCVLQIDSRDLWEATNKNLLLRLRVAAHKCDVREVKQLPATAALSFDPWAEGSPAPDSKLAPGYQPAGSSDEVIQWLQQRVAYLERELAGAEDRHAKLNNIYNKLADQWNAFQATARPDNRNVHRAEAAGELSRKLAEVFLALAYGKQITEQESKLLSGVLWKASGEAP